MTDDSKEIAPGVTAALAEPRQQRIDAALAVIRQDYSPECAAMASRREYVLDAVRQLIDAGWGLSAVPPEPPTPVAEYVDVLGFSVLEWIGDWGDRLPIGTKLYAGSQLLAPNPAKDQP